MNKKHRVDPKLMNGLDEPAVEEVEELVQGARSIAEKKLWPESEKWESSEDIPHSVFRLLGERGLLGVNVERRYGGASMGVTAYARALKEIARGDAAVAVTMSVSNMVAEVLSAFACEEDVALHVPKICSGEYYGAAFALSEPGAGSDAGAMRTQATSAADGFRINGEKLWISHGDRAGAIVVWARTGSLGSKGISAFIVSGDAPGLSAGKPEKKMGLRASHTVPLIFNDVLVGRRALLGAENEGFKLAMIALDGGRIGISAQACGMAQRALEAVSAWASGTDTAQAWACRELLANFATELDAAWLLTMRAAHLKEAGRVFSREAAIAKVYSTEMVNRQLRASASFVGQDGSPCMDVLNRLLRDARVTQIYEGTSEIQRIVIARDVLREEKGRAS